MVVISQPDQERQQPRLARMKSLLILASLVAVCLGLPRQNPKLRISGGVEQETPIGYVVSIQDVQFGEHFHICGGSIIDAQWILTSAICLDGEDDTYPENLVVVAGDHRLYVHEGPEQSLRISRIKIHPDFSSFTRYNDIAVVLLDGSLDVSVDEVYSISYVQQRPDMWDGMVFSISGWGDLNENGGRPERLQKASVTTVAWETCQEAMGSNLPEGVISTSMVCAASSDFNQNFCAGDIGGSLIYNDNEIYGIMSWTVGCGMHGNYGVYTSVADYAEWIKQETGI